MDFFTREIFQKEEFVKILLIFQVNIALLGKSILKNNSFTINIICI